MSIARHIEGLVLALIAFGPVVVGARAARARLLAGWTGPPAAVGTVVVAVGLVTIVSQGLGLLGLFSTLPLVLGLVVAGVAAARWGSRADGPPTHAPSNRLAPARLPRSGLLLAAASSAVVLAEWGSRTVEQLRSGMDTIDTLWYHMPVAARFAQTGEITPLHHLETQPLTVFYPANSALWHGLGIELFGNDLASILMNLGWLVLAMLAGWAIGRPHGVAPVALSAVAVVFSLPALTGTQPGSAYNDAAGIFFVLAAIAIYVEASRDRRLPRSGELVVIGASIGLAVGTKFHFLLPGAVLTLGIIALGHSGDRLRRLRWLLGPIALTGSFWYLRNLVVAGSPLPALEFSLGPIDLPSTPPRTQITTLVEYLSVRRFWSDYFFPGFDQAYGALWPLILVTIVGFLGIALARGRDQLMLTVVALATLLGFAVSPAALSFGSEPTLFVYALRYTGMAITLGVLVAVLTAASGPRWQLSMLSGVMTAVLLSIVVDASDWPEPREGRLDEPIWALESLVALAIAALIVASVWFGWRWIRRGGIRPALPAAVLIVLVMLASIPTLLYYRDGRYESMEFLPETYAAAADLRDARIGLVGLKFQYPMYGDDLGNHVQVLARWGDHGEVDKLEGCADLRRLVNDERYDYVIVAHGGFPLVTTDPVEAEWLDDDHATTLLATEGPVSLFRVDAALDPLSCPHGPTRLTTVWR